MIMQIKGTSVGTIAASVLLLILSGCLTSSHSKVFLPKAQTFLSSSENIGFNKGAGVAVRKEGFVRQNLAQPLSPDDQKLLHFIWLVNKILLFFVILLSTETIGHVFFKEKADQKRLRVLAHTHKSIQRLALADLNAFKKMFPKMAATISPKQFFKMTKSWGKIYPEELERYFKNFLLTSDKIPKIEHQARKSRNKWQRIEAITFLGYVNPPSAPDILKKSLLDKDSDVSYFSMLALSRIRNREAARILLNFLGKRVFSGYKIVSLLENFPPFIIDEIVAVAKSFDATTRFWAVKLLSKFKPQDQWQTVAALTDDPSPDVRAAACECLGILGKKEAKAILVKHLHDKIWFVRMQAVRALFKIVGAECFPELIKLMADDSSSFVKESVKNAIVSDIEKVIPYVEQCFEGGDETVKEYCVDALVDSNYISEILGNVLSREPEVRNRAERLLKGMIKSKIYFGLKKSLDALSSHSRERILEMVRGIDEDLASRMMRESLNKA